MRRHDRFTPEPLRGWMQRDTPAYDFERWQRSPVYVAQCFTCAAYLSLGGRIGGLRIKRRYRKPEDQAKRDETARLVRQMRRDGLTRDDVMRQHEARLLDSRGVAVRVDIDQELERMRSA